jgi:hypothetical protein
MDHKLNLNMNQVSQGLHDALGALFLLIPVAKGWHHPRVKGAEVGIAYAAIKEFIFDIKFETYETSGGWIGGLKDFSFYVVGLAAAWVVLIV